MKRTKNMYYEMSEEARELILVAENDGELYERYIKPVIKNLQKHYNKGVYDVDKAVDSYYRIATAASDKYYIDYGYRFSVQQRYTAAVVMEQDFRECYPVMYKNNTCLRNIFLRHFLIFSAGYVDDEVGNFRSSIVLHVTIGSLLTYANPPVKIRQNTYLRASFGAIKIQYFRRNKKRKIPAQ